MTKQVFAIILLATGMAATGCSEKHREPGDIYMPDMAYSRGYETYLERDSNHFTTYPANPDDKIFYNSKPVPGTFMRGESITFTLPKDVAGDSTNYVAAKLVQNPITAPDANTLKEGERLYLINCAICHGTKLDGNGPLYKGGDGPYPAKPATLVGDAKYESMPAGQMYYSVTFGKNLMGPYGSQLDHYQRWMVISYIKSKQAGNKGGAGAAGDAATTDSTATAKK